MYPRALVSPKLLSHYTEIKMYDLRTVAEQERPATLADLMFRCVRAGWTATFDSEAAERAATSVTDTMDWVVTRVREEVRRYREYLAENHLLNPSFVTKR